MENPSSSDSSDTSEDLSNSAYLLQTLSALTLSNSGSSDSDMMEMTPAPQNQHPLTRETREQLSLNTLADARFTPTGLAFDQEDQHAIEEINRVRLLVKNSTQLTPAEFCLYLLTANKPTDQLIDFDLSSIQHLQNDLSYLSAIRFEPLNGFISVSDHWKQVLLRLQLFFANQLLLQIKSDTHLSDDDKNERLNAAATHSLFAPFGVIRQTIYLTSTLFGTPYCASQPAQLFLDAIKKMPEEGFTPYTPF